jgi:Ni/Co efflux regulator RcnB
MKLIKLIAAAGLMTAALGVSAGANAQRYDHDRGNSRHEHRDSRDDRRHQYGRHDHGHHYGRDRYRRCRTEWRHHHRVRVCR